MKKIYIFLLFIGFTLPTFAFTVVLDAGHGGNDAGAVGSFSKEKNINLRYTLLVGDMIKKNIPDAKVIYTRDKDVFVNLNERARIANKNKADLFISIHTNSSKNSSANGMEIHRNHRRHQYRQYKKTYDAFQKGHYISIYDRSAYPDSQWI